MPVQPTKTKVPGEPYLYEAVYPSGTKRYQIDFSRDGFNRKKSFPFTPEGLKDARNAREKIEKDFRKAFGPGAKKGGEPITKTITKLKNPPDPKKPWRYKGNQGTTYYATEAQAKAAQKKVMDEYLKGKEKPLTKNELKTVETEFKKNPNLAKISRDTGIPIKRVTNAVTELGLELPEAFINDPKNRKYVLANYGKKTRETMAKELFPGVKFDTANSRLGQLIQSLRKSNEIKEPVAAFNIEEVREKYKFNPDQAAKDVRTKRKAAIKKFSVPAFEAAMRGSKASQLSHMDDLYSQVVRFETLGYSPQRINQEILKNVDPYFNTLYKQREKLLKNKPVGFAKKVNEINNKGIAASYATKGYKSFNVVEPGGKSYAIGVDATKSLDPFGIFEGKSLQEVFGKDLTKGRRKDINFLARKIPDPVERYFFLENAKEVQKAQARVPKTEVDAIAKNLKELGFVVDSFAKKVKSIPGGCRAVVTRALGGPIDACEAIIKADPKAAAVKLNNAITATKGPLKELKEDSKKLANFIDTGQITTADKLPRPDDAKLADTFKETNLRWNNDIGAFVTPDEDIASQADLKKYAADNPMEVKVGEEPVKAATNKSVLANVGKAMARVGAPLPVAAIDAYFIGQQVKEGKGTAEIASNPLNWLGLATMEPLAKASGIAEGGALNKALRLGLNPATIRGITRFAGLPGLAVSTAMTAYDQYQKYKDGEGFIFNLLNQKGTE